MDLKDKGKILVIKHRPKSQCQGWEMTLLVNFLSLEHKDQSWGAFLKPSAGGGTEKGEPLGIAGQ